MSEKGTDARGAEAVPRASNKNQAAANVMDKYLAELEQTYSVLRHRSVELNETVQKQLTKLNENFQYMQPQLKRQGNEVLQSLQDVESLKHLPSKCLLDVFAWISIMKLGYLVGSIIGGYFLFPFIGFFIGDFWASSLAYVLLPGLMLSQLLTTDKQSDQPMRYKLLLLALAQGVLTGYLFSNRYLSTMQPIALLTPLLVAVSTQYAVPLLGAFPPRTYVLGALLIPGVFAHLTVGFVIGSLSLPYLVLTLLYTGVAYCIIQLLFKYANDNTHLYMLAYFVFAVYAQGLVFLLFGDGAESSLTE